LAAVVSRAETQTWTSADGRTIEGEFVRLFGSSVTVKRPNGMTASFQLSSLDEASREQAKRLAEAAKSGGAMAGASKQSTLKLSSAKASGIPSEEEIKAFITEYKETPTSDESTEFFANFSVPALKPDEIKDFQRKKKVPYRVTIELCKAKIVDGKKRFVRMDGQGFMVVLNEAGDVIDRQRESLGKLCPS
jgi:hypothetical protein